MQRVERLVIPFADGSKREGNEESHADKRLTKTASDSTSVEQEYKGETHRPGVQELWILPCESIRDLVRACSLVPGELYTPEEDMQGREEPNEATDPPMEPSELVEVKIGNER